MKYIILLASGFLLLQYNSFAQSTGDLAEYLTKDSISQAEQYNEFPSQLDNQESTKNTKKFDFALNTGMSAMAGSNQMTAFNKYIAPELRCYITPRFHMSVGVVMQHLNYNNLELFTGDSFVKKSGTHTNAVVYANAEYLVNDRLTITGQVIYDMNPMSATNQQANPRVVSYSVGGEYKISDNFRIGFQFSQGERSSFYNQNSFMSPYFSTPYSTPFR